MGHCPSNLSVGVPAANAAQSYIIRYFMLKVCFVSAPIC